MNAHIKHSNNCPLCKAETKARFSGYKLNAAQGLFPERNYQDAQRVYRCKTCDLYYNYPQVIHSNGVFDDDDSLVELTGQDAETIKIKGAYTDILDFLKNEAKLKPGAKVLDMGSGIGRVAYMLRKEGYETYAVEPKKQLFDFAVHNSLTDKDKSFNKSFDTIEFEEGSFDFIFLEPLHHMHNPREAMQKALRWLKPEGYMQLEVVNSKWLYKSLLNFFYKITLRKHVPFTSALRKPFYACEYSAKSFEVFSDENNLEISWINSYACDTSITNRFLDKWVSYYMWRFKRGMEISVILKKK